MDCSRSSRRRQPRATGFVSTALVGLFGLALAAGCGGSGSKPNPDGGAPAMVNFNPASHNFMNVTVGQVSQGVEFTIASSATATLNAVSAALVGTDVSQFRLGSNTCTMAITRGGSCKVSVQFAPTSAGMKTAAIEFRSGITTKRAELTGTGIRGVALTVTPVSGDFGLVPQGTESEQKTFIVKNEGGVEAPRPTVVPAADFPVKNNGCSGPLAANATCELKVAFAPSTVGSRMGTMIVSVPDSNPFMVPMSGTGTERPIVVATPSAVDFGDIPVGRTASQVVMLRNPNTMPVTGLAITPQNPSYTVSANTCTGMMIAANGMCSVTVTFSPGAVGQVRSELTIAVAGGGSTAVPLTGRGIRAAILEFTTESHDFMSVPVGVRQGGVTITLSNVGQETATGVSVQLTGADAGEFEIEPNCPTTLMAGAMCDIRVFFKPANTGAATATLTATGSPGGMDTATLTGTGVPQPSISLSPTSHDFGTVQVGQNGSPVTFDVMNTGGVGTGALTFTFPASSEFRLVDGSSTLCAAGIAAGQTCSVQVQFSPTSSGTKTSTLTVSGPGVGTISAQLTGIAINPARLVITPPTGNLGVVAVGQMGSEVPFTVTNAGGMDSGVVSVVPGSAQFQIVSNACQNKTLAPGDSCIVGVRFVPATPGDVSSTLTATATPGGSGTAMLMAAGTAAAGIAFQNGAGVSISVLDFGPTEVQVGVTTAPVTVFVRNVGMVGTGMLATVLAGANPADFAVVDGTNSCGAGLAVGAVCSMQIVFKPTLGGAREATLSVSSGSGGMTSLLLKGPGAEVFRWETGMPLSAVTAFDFATLSAGQTTTQTFTLRALAPTGTYTINLEGGAPPNFVRLAGMAGGTCNGTALATNATCTVVVQFQPQLPLGAKMGTLTATNSSSRSAAVALAGNSGGPLQFTPAPHVFASLATGNSDIDDFTLRNNGAAAVTGLTISLAMSSSGDLSIAETDCGPMLASGDDCTVRVRFLAGVPGTKTATLTATGSFVAGGNPQTATATSALTATVSGTASISVTGSGEFGSVVVGSDSEVRTFTVTNATGAPVSGGVNVGAVVGAGFTKTRDGCLLADNVTRLPLAAGQSCSFDVRFSPATIGPLSATILVSASPGGAVSVVLNGSGLTRLTLEPAARDLDAGGTLNVADATNTRFEFTVTNRGLGTETLTFSNQISTALGASPADVNYFGRFASTSAPCPGALAPGASCKIDVAMITPAMPALGRKFMTLQVTGTNAGSTATSEVSGTLRADAVLDFSDTSPRNFGNVKVNTASGIHFVQVRNSGGIRSGPFQITPITGGFRQMPATGTNPATGNAICSPGIQLDPAQICDFLLQFAPTAVGASAITLDIWVTGPGEKSASAPGRPGLPGPRQLMLSGTGVAATNISLTPTPVDFGGSPSGAAGVDRTVTLNNDTGLALAIGSIALVGPPAGFTLGANTCGMSVAAGMTCTITVTFTAAGAPARQTDTLRVVATPMGGGAETVDAVLVGQVLTPPTLLIEPPAEGADWGGALVGVASKRTFTIRNVGQGDTTAAAMVSVGGGQAGDFLVGDNTCTAALAPNAACTVSVTLTPGAVGARATTLTATAGAASDTQALAGTGVVPSAIQLVSISGGGMVVNFGNKAVLSETGIDVVVKNADDAQTIAAPTFAPSDTVNFRVDTNPGVGGMAPDCFDEIADGGGLEGGEQCTIRVFFRPQSLPASSVMAPNMTTTVVSTGASTNLTLMVQGNAVSALSISLATKDYMGVAVNGSSTQLFTITNSNDAGITTTDLVAVSLDGANPGDYRIATNTCAASAGLAPGDTCTVTVAFEPKSTGTKTATLAVSATPTNGTSASLTGVGQ